MDINQISEFFALRMIPKDKLNQENIEVISYGVCALLTSLINLIFCGISAYVFHQFEDYLIFIICFIPIRCYHVGFHCRTFYHCLITTNIAFTLSTYFIRWVEQAPYITLIFMICLIMHYIVSLERRIPLHFIIVIVYIFNFWFQWQIAAHLVMALILDMILIEGGK